MTNTSITPDKVATRRRLKALGIQALEEGGWKVTAAGLGKSSMRKISKDGLDKLATIRTSQDTWIAFPRNENDTGWATLDQADIVVAASVDQGADSRWLQVHIIDADEMRDRFDRAYAARKRAGYQIDKGRGVWISLYEDDSEHPVTLVGAGAGTAHEAVLRVPFSAASDVETPFEPEPSGASLDWEIPPPSEALPQLTIAQAKAALARALGVDESAIKISIEA